MVNPKLAKLAAGSFKVDLVGGYGLIDLCKRTTNAALDDVVKQQESTGLQDWDTATERFLPNKRQLCVALKASHDSQKQLYLVKSSRKVPFRCDHGRVSHEEVDHAQTRFLIEGAAPSLMRVWLSLK